MFNRILCMLLVLGITGVGFGVPGATPGTGIGGVPDGAAVVVPGATGELLVILSGYLIFN